MFRAASLPGAAGSTSVAAPYAARVSTIDFAYCLVRIINADGASRGDEAAGLRQRACRATSMASLQALAFPSLQRNQRLNPP